MSGLASFVANAQSFVADSFIDVEPGVVGINYQFQPKAIALVSEVEVLSFVTQEKK